MQAGVVANAGPFAEATKSKPPYKDNYFIPRAFSCAERDHFCLRGSSPKSGTQQARIGNSFSQGAEIGHGLGRPGDACPKWSRRPQFRARVKQDCWDVCGMGPSGSSGRFALNGILTS